MNNFKEQCGLGQDNYPKTLEGTKIALNNYKWDNAWKKHTEN